jgi:hypothetical protein
MTLLSLASAILHYRRLVRTPIGSLVLPRCHTYCVMPCEVDTTLFVLWSPGVPSQAGRKDVGKGRNLNAENWLASVWGS